MTTFWHEFLMGVGWCGGDSTGSQTLENHGWVPMIWWVCRCGIDGKNQKFTETWPISGISGTRFWKIWFTPQTKNKKIHSGLLQFAVKLIDTMLHAYMVWGLQTTLQKHCKSPQTNSGTKWRSMDFVRIASLTSHWGLPMIWWVCRCGIDGQTPRNDRNMSHDFQNLGCPQTENMQILQHPVMFCTVKLIDT